MALYVLYVLIFQIEADFNRLHPNKECCLLSNWNTFFQKIIEIKEEAGEINKRDPILVDLYNILKYNSQLSEGLYYLWF